MGDIQVKLFQNLTNGSRDGCRTKSHHNNLNRTFDSGELKTNIVLNFDYNPPIENKRLLGTILSQGP